MSGVKHTPWKHEWVEESSDWAVFGCVYPPDADGIAHQPGICTLSDFCDEDEARLIASAPDLLEAGAELQAARKAQKLAPSAENLSRVRRASDAFDAAIARARGKQDGGGE